MMNGGDLPAAAWVESSGGPLVVAPVAGLGSWSGAVWADDGEQVEDDYARACAVEGPIGLIRVGEFDALILGDEPATTTFLPDRGLFVRWGAAPSEEAMLASIDAALDAVMWEEEVLWQVPGPVVLLNAVLTGAECLSQDQVGTNGFRHDHVQVDMAAGTYVVRAANAWPDPQISFGLVELRRRTD